MSKERELLTAATAASPTGIARVREIAAQPSRNNRGTKQSPSIRTDALGR